MKLKKPIVLQPPLLKKSDGTTKQYPPITITELDVMFMDFPLKKYVTAKILPCPKTVTLWEGLDYDAIGDWTQKQAEEKLLSILGKNPKKVLETLFW